MNTLNETSINHRMRGCVCKKMYAVNTLSASYVHVCNDKGNRLLLKGIRHLHVAICVLQWRVEDKLNDSSMCHV